MADLLQSYWDELLSRQPERIRTAYATLSEEEQSAVLAHLNRMASEPDWHPEQVKSAASAIETIQGEKR